MKHELSLQWSRFVWQFAHFEKLTLCCVTQRKLYYTEFKSTIINEVAVYFAACNMILFLMQPKVYG